MRLRTAILTLALATFGSAQVWEKPIAPGLLYREEVDLSVPRILHAIRFSQGSPGVRAASELAGGNVFADDLTKGRETISQMVGRTGALAGINGDFFPFTGQPLGVAIHNDELITIPGIPRAVFGWGPKDTAFGFITFTGSVTGDGMSPITIDCLNGECLPDCVAVNTQTAGLAISKQPGEYAVLEMDDPQWKPTGTNAGTVVSVTPDQNKVPIGPHQMVLVGTGAKRGQISALHLGDHLAINFHTSGMAWDRIHETIGGGPFLVRAGQIAVDAEQEKFDDKFSKKRHPRSAVGRTAQGDLWFVAVDGRAKISDGATLEEMAAIMKRLGCVDAINLDGGGSTTLNILGLTVNRPSDGKERPVANGVMFYGPKPDPSEANLSLRPADSIPAGSGFAISVVDPSGLVVPNTEVLWSSSGAAGWVDQGGQIHAVAVGSLTVAATVRGRFISKQVMIIQNVEPASRAQEPEEEEEAR